MVWLCLGGWLVCATLNTLAAFLINDWDETSPPILIFGWFAAPIILPIVAVVFGFNAGRVLTERTGLASRRRALEHEHQLRLMRIRHKAIEAAVEREELE